MLHLDIKSWWPKYNEGLLTLIPLGLGQTMHFNVIKFLRCILHSEILESSFGVGRGGKEQSWGPWTVLGWQAKARPKKLYKACWVSLEYHSFSCTSSAEPSVLHPLLGRAGSQLDSFQLMKWWFQQKALKPMRGGFIFFPVIFSNIYSSGYSIQVSLA